MRTTVDFHRDIQTGLAGWVLLHPEHAADRLAMWRGVYRPEVEARLVASAGDESRLLALGAFRVAGLRPPVYDWHYSADLWLRFVVRTRRSLLRTSVRVTVLLVSHERPSPAGP
jgi:hypothetical protein